MKFFARLWCAVFGHSWSRAIRWWRVDFICRVCDEQIAWVWKMGTKAMTEDHNPYDAGSTPWSRRKK